MCSYERCSTAAATRAVLHITHELRCGRTVLSALIVLTLSLSNMLKQALSTLGKAQQGAVTAMEEKHQAAAKRVKSQIDRIVKSA
jgi:hypothetical protein